MKRNKFATVNSKKIVKDPNEAMEEAVKIAMRSRNLAAKAVAAMGLAFGSMVVAATPFHSAHADEADAKRILQAMSDYLASQETISFSFDTSLEVVTEEDQKLALASSGTVVLNRPDKIRATRSGGFADVEFLFDGEVLTLIGKVAKVYTQLDFEGSIDQLADELSDKYNRPLPAADLLISNPYDELMADVIDIKDLGSGVIDGVECDFLAFRTEEVDWQIWVAQGDRPYPCRYVITTKEIAHSPQYSIQIGDWKTGDDATSGDFEFHNPTNADKIELEELQAVVTDLPQHFTQGGEK